MRSSDGLSFFNTVILRTPLLPFHTLMEVLDCKDIRQTQAAVRKVYEQDHVREALFLASPVLYNQLVRWEKGELEGDNKSIEQLHISLFKYLTRMSSRSTPFGLFSGCSLLKAADDTRIVMAVPGESQRTTRLDTYYACAIIDFLLKRESIRNSVRFFANSTLYRAGGQIRYVEYEQRTSKRLHRITGIQPNELLDDILNEVCSGKSGLKRKDIIDKIVGEGYAEGESAAYVDELIDSRILISELEPSVSGPDILSLLKINLEKLCKETDAGAGESRTDIEHITMLLDKIESGLRKLDKKIGNPVSQYSAVEELLQQFDIPLTRENLFQTDLIKPTHHSSISRKVVESFGPLLEVLLRLSLDHSKTTLDHFREAFTERYEDQEVSLMEVLDPDTGLGYAHSFFDSGDVNPLVDDISTRNDNKQEFAWDAVQALLHRKITESYRKKESSIEITDDEIKHLPIRKGLPPTTSLLFKCYQTDTGQELLYYIGAGGASAASIHTRFCHADERLESFVREIIGKEDELNRTAIFAEIVHLPESRLGNIVMRPAFRRYEIPYLSASLKDDSHRIPVQDLLVSVKGGRIVLRSKRLNKEIIPRLTNTHNFSASRLPVYQFLCDVQNQESRSGLRFHWGFLESEYRFLPRISYRNIVLSPATWQLTATDYKDILAAKSPEDISRWQNTLELPRYFYLADEDNEMLVDLENELSVKAFARTIKNRPSIKLIEYINEESSFIRDDQGRVYAGQFVASILNMQWSVPPTASTDPSEAQPSPQRRFLTGSRWLYYKLYCGNKVSDTILHQAIIPAIRSFQSEGLLSRWFFIRYSDPNFHLRIRFEVTGEESLLLVIARLNGIISSCMDQGLIWKCQTENYTRELERYGAPTIEDVEGIFSLDSEASCHLMQILAGDENEKWLLALKSIDAYLSDFGLDAEKKYTVAHGNWKAFSAEFSSNREILVQLDKKYRRFREDIGQVMKDQEPYAQKSHPIRLRSQRIQPLVRNILVKSQSNQRTLSQILFGIIHMHINRLFRSKQRLNEFYLYYFLSVYYKSEIAKQKAAGKEETVES